MNRRAQRRLVEEFKAANGGRLPAMTDWRRQGEQAETPGRVVEGYAPRALSELRWARKTARAQRSRLSTKAAAAQAAALVAAEAKRARKRAARRRRRQKVSA